MMKDKKSMIILFPHLPNPRMIKRINALKQVFNIEVIYWDRETESQKINNIPSGIQTNVIRRRANEGNPLRRIGTTLKVIKDSLKIIRQNKPQQLYISKLDMLLVGILYKRFFDKSVDITYEVSDLHSLVIDNHQNIKKRIISKIIKGIEKFLCKDIKLLVVTSDYFYKCFYKDFIDEDRVIFIPNTPNPSVFSSFERKQNKKFTIGFIGAIRYAEQIEMLINVGKKCDVNILIAGKGVDYNRIKEYSKNKNYVSIYGEYEYEQEIKKIYEKVDCVYSVYDASLRNVQIALPNRLYEAIYTNTPIIAARNTYLGEIIEKEQIGEVIMYDNSQELVDKINILKNDENRTNNISKKMDILKKKWILTEYNKKLIEKIKV